MCACTPAAAQALFASVALTARKRTSTIPPLTPDHVAPPSTLRKTPALLAAQIVFGSDGAATTAVAAPPVGPCVLQPAKGVVATKRRTKNGFMESSAPDRKRV